VLEAESQVLPREDEEIAGVLEQSLTEQGINVHTGVKVSRVGKGKRGSMEVAYGGGEDGDQQLNATKVLMAVGVGGNIEGLGLEAACVQTERGAIVVNGRMETNIKGIFAIGDVVGPPQLAHVASAEAVAAVEFMAGKERPELARDSIPGCVYCQPQVASVGLTEKDAIAAGHDVRVGRFPFAASGKARAIGETEGLVKLVFEAKYGELLGASIVGSEATEMIAELGLARTLEATHDELLQTVHAHPTLSEAVMEAAGEALGEAINI
jgi:dihydrolipoamide dehydrogenase